MKKIVLILFSIWIVLWVNFILRDLFVRGDFADYKVLLTRDRAGKTSYAYGDRLFKFLNFCKESLPEQASYALLGVEKLSLADRHVTYYLYPHIRKENPDFLLIFNTPGFNKEGYRSYKRLNEETFILRST